MLVTYHLVLFQPAAAGNTTILADVGSITFAGFAPMILVPTTLTPGTGQMVFAGFAPTITVAQTINAGVGSIVFTGQAPTLLTPVTVSAGVGAMVFSGQAPTIKIAVLVAAGVGSMVFSGQAPTVVVSNNTTLQPGTGQIVFSGQAPTITGQVASAPAVGGRRPKRDVEREKIQHRYDTRRAMVEARERNQAREEASEQGDPPPVEMAPIPVEVERVVPLRVRLAHAEALIQTLERQIKALELRNEDLENLNAALLAMEADATWMS